MGVHIPLTLPVKLCITCGQCGFSLEYTQHQKSCGKLWIKLIFFHSLLHRREIEYGTSTEFYPQESGVYPQVLGDLCTNRGSGGFSGGEFVGGFFHRVEQVVERVEAPRDALAVQFQQAAGSLPVFERLFGAG